MDCFDRFQARDAGRAVSRLRGWAALLFAILCTPFASALAQVAVFEESEFIKAGHKPIDGVRVSEMFLGNTAFVLQLTPQEGKDAGYVRIYYFKSKDHWIQRGTNGDAVKKIVFQGDWWMDGDKWCMRAAYRDTTWQGGCTSANHCTTPVTMVSSCRHLYDLGGVVYGCTNLRCAWVVRTVPGNPENL